MSLFFKNMFSVKMITLNAIVAALYAVITISIPILSYNFMQFRVAELLNLLVFFNPSYTIGLTIGCLLANLFSTAGIFDIVIGTLATFISCLLISAMSRTFNRSLFLNGLVPCLINAIAVPFIIYLASLGTADEFILESGIFFIMAGWTFLGEFLAINVLGYMIFMILKKTYPHFFTLINSTQDLAKVKW